MTENRSENVSLIHITSLHYEPDSPDIKGFRFVADYNNAQARATILVEHASLDPKRPETFCDELRRLAHSLLEAAQRPQGIHWHLQDER